jgi:small subunit ribosomal protein S6
MNQYDGLFILNLQGKEDNLKEAIETVEKEIAAQGGKVHGVQKMDKRRFERVSGALDQGYYCNIEFSIGPDKLDAMKQKLKLNPLVFRQFYLRQQTRERAAA